MNAIRPIEGDLFADAPSSIAATLSHRSAYISTLKPLRELTEARINAVVHPPSELRTMNRSAARAGDRMTTYSEVLKRLLEPLSLSDDKSEKVVTPPQQFVVRDASAKRPLPTFRSYKEWEGEVTTITDSGFVARIFPKSSPDVEQRTVFEFDELDDSERGSVRVGAKFSWHIGYYETEHKQRMKAQRIVFRLNRWTAQRIERAKRAAQEAAEVLGWTNEGATTSP